MKLSAAAASWMKACKKSLLLMMLMSINCQYTILKCHNSLLKIKIKKTHNTTRIQYIGNKLIYKKLSIWYCLKFILIIKNHEKPKNLINSFFKTSLKYNLMEKTSVKIVNLYMCMAESGAPVPQRA